VRPSRYWNETPAKEITDDELLYSLSDYWPGMPIQTDIVCDNSSLGLLPVYKNLEARFGSADIVTGKKPIDATATIQRLVELRAIPDTSQQSLEDFMMKVESMEDKYALCARNWSFLVAQRLLKMQLSRLKIIKTALAEKKSLTTIRCPALIALHSSTIPMILLELVQQQQASCPKAQSGGDHFVNTSNIQLIGCGAFAVNL
jgi:hypothetical protein